MEENKMEGATNGENENVDETVNQTNDSLAPAEAITVDENVHEIVVPTTEEPIVNSEENTLAMAMEQEEEVHTEVLTNLSKDELLKKLTEVAQADDVAANFSLVKGLREAFFAMQHEEVERHKQKFLEDGGLMEEYQPFKDEQDITFHELFKGFDARRQELKKKKDIEQNANTAVRKNIVEKIKNLAEEANTGKITVKQVFDHLHEYQDAWRGSGAPTPAEARPLQDSYRYACEKVYEYIQINKELRDLDFKKNLELKKELCEKAEKFMMDDSLKTSIEGVRSLQEQWKEVGFVSREVNEAIWERFKVACDSVFSRQKQYVDALKQKQNENMAIKTALCTRLAEAIETTPSSNTEWQKMTEKIEELLGEWKQAGFAPKKENEELWNTFKGLRDKFFKAKESFFEVTRKKYQDNYKIKNDLCMQVEALKDSTDWKQTTELIIKLQKQWKEAGPVSYKHSEKIWQRFRGACDSYFDRKKENFAEQDANNEQNLVAKKALIEQIEQYVPVSDSNINFENLKKFQNDWLEIGHVPMKEKDKVNKKYRDAIDKHFDAMRNGKAERTKMQFQNRVDSFASQPGGKYKLNDEMFQIQDKIKRKESEASLLENNIGFFGKSKNAEVIIKETTKKIDAIRLEIKGLKEQMKLLRAMSQTEETK